MSNIDAQIKALQAKKKKIDYLSYVADLIKNDTKCIDFKDVQKEIAGRIEPILIQMMTDIENDVQTSLQTGDGFTKDQIDILKKLADRAMSKPATTNSQNTQQSKNTQKSAQTESEMSPNEKMNFAMDNRHLAGRSVNVLDSDDKIISDGTVSGLDAPYVCVKTSTGPIIKVPLNKVVLK